MILTPREKEVEMMRMMRQEFLQKRLEMACALCEERYDGWGLTLNVILTQTSTDTDSACLTLKSHLGVTSLIDIQRRDKTGHFSSNGFCPFFVLFLMDKVFKVMSRTGL